MNNFFQDLFKYSHHVNVQLIHLLNENKTKEIEPVLRLMSHILNSHHIWNAQIKNAPKAYTPWDMHSPEELVRIEQENFDCTMQLLNEFELTQSVTYTIGSGKQFTNTAQEIFFQVINHSTYHRGQIATAFKKAGIDPILTEYISYKWKES